MTRKDYEREIRYRKRKRRRIKEMFILTAVLVILAAGTGVILNFLLGQPPSVISVPEKRAEEELLLSDSPLLDKGTAGDAENRGDSLADQQPAGTHTDEYSGKELPEGSISGLDVDLTHLYSRYAILVDCDSGISLAEHDARARIYPASMTKIMTAVLAVENTADMGETITVPEDIFPQLYEEDASMAGFLPGESASLRDLLYGILLPSGAECCLTFAYRIAGSEAAFVEMMNRKAEELGLVNTHFCNATGLHDPDHYSTVEDISILLRYALQSQPFRDAFVGSRYSVAPTEKHPDGFTFVSTMFPYMDSAEVIGGRILGGKTGYTEEAGQCLASLAEIYGKEYILVTAKAEGTHETEQFHILDAQNVYDQIGTSVGTGIAGPIGTENRTEYWREDEQNE